MKYKHGIIVGTSNIAFQCAEKLREELPVTVIENASAKFSGLNVKCRKVGIKCIQAGKKEIMAELADTKEPTIVFSVLNTYLFPPSIVRHPMLTIVNYHGALLPKYPGRNAEAWAIYEGASESGCTWHYIDECVDCGNMIVQEKVPITSSMTAGELFSAINEQAYCCFCRILPDVLNGTAPKIRLNTNSADIKLSHEIPNNGFLDISWDYEKASRFLRSMDFGVFPQFPPAGIMFDGTVYNWKKYLLVPMEKTERFSYQFTGQDIELHFVDGKIILKKVNRVA